MSRQNVFWVILCISPGFQSISLFVMTSLICMQKNYNNMYLIVRLCPFNFVQLKKQSIPVSKSHDGTCALVALAVSK